MVDRLQFREHVLAACGAEQQEIAALLAYNENLFSVSASQCEFPLEDEPFVSVWRSYAREVLLEGSIGALARHLPQLRFPIQSGISQTPEYISATRWGRFSTEGQLGCELLSPHAGRLIIHPTGAGHIPLIIAHEREDFVTLVRALARKNEPAAIPASMGAAMIAGFNNWERIHALRDEYERCGGTEWEKEFQLIKLQKPLYQDSFILLGRGPYSGILASDLHLNEEEWLNISLVIRREHECAHYFTRRVFSSMRNNLLDELIADYFGITAAVGRFRADWALRFFGLESFPEYRQGGRMENYRGNPPLSSHSFRIMQRLLMQSAHNLENFDQGLPRGARPAQLQTMVFATLAEFTLEELASEHGPNLLRERFSVVEKHGHAAPDAVQSR